MLFDIFLQNSRHQPNFFYYILLPVPNSFCHKFSESIDPFEGVDHTYRSFRRRPGAGGRGQARVSWSPSWSPCPGRPRSPGAGTWSGAWRGGGPPPGHSQPAGA